MEYAGPSGRQDAYQPCTRERLPVSRTRGCRWLHHQQQQHAQNAGTALHAVSLWPCSVSDPQHEQTRARAPTAGGGGGQGGFHVILGHELQMPHRLMVCHAQSWRPCCTCQHLNQHPDNDRERALLLDLFCPVVPKASSQASILVIVLITPRCRVLQQREGQGLLWPALSPLVCTGPRACVTWLTNVPYSLASCFLHHQQ